MKKAKKNKRTTKAERMRAEAEACAPKNTTVSNSWDGEVGVVSWYNYEISQRRTSLSADRMDDHENGCSGTTIEFSDPLQLRRISAALDAAADWMEDAR
jgi:hypothetical protein